MDGRKALAEPCQITPRLDLGPEGRRVQLLLDRRDCHHPLMRILEVLACLF